MNQQKVENITIEGASIIFRNFSGKEDQFNRAGNRTFCVVIDDEEFANKLREDGWNVKPLHSLDPDEPQRYILQVTVSYKVAPPTVYMVTNKKRTPLDEESINTLDYAEIKNVDLTIRPYAWEVQGKSGIKAYLKTMYVTIEEDRLASKYSELDGQETFDDDMPF